MSSTSWRLDIESEWTNVSTGAVRFGSPATAGRPNAGYGGLFLRGAQDLRGAEVILDGEVMTAAQAMGQRGNWLALSQPTASRSLVMIAHSDNPVQPTSWFVRTDQTVMLCAAPFFHEEWELGSGRTARWTWSLLVADEEWNAGAIAEALRA